MIGLFCALWTWIGAISAQEELPNRPTQLLIIGDSLTEGYGVEKSQAFPTILETLFAQEQLNVKVINGGIGGSTSASGLSRLKWFKKLAAPYLLLALGANDGLRGLPLEKTQENLQQIIEEAKNQKMIVVLAGMQMPPNYGRQFQKQYQNIFRELCQRNHLVCIDFLLADVAGKKELNQPDGIHPNEAGHQIIAKNIYPSLKKTLFPNFHATGEIATHKNEKGSTMSGPSDKTAAHPGGP